MRVNIYSQDLTDEIEVIKKESNTGVTYDAVRLILHSSSMLHHPPKDDDRSAITFWLPKSQQRRKQLAQTLEKLAQAVRNASYSYLPPKEISK